MSKASFPRPLRGVIPPLATPLLDRDRLDHAGLERLLEHVLGGGVHGLFLLVSALPLLPFVHPRMASDYHGATVTRQLEPPGFLALNYGRRTPVSVILAHLLYGGVLGAFYQVR